LGIFISNIIVDRIRCILSVWTDRVTQVVEHLLNKHKALSSNPNIKKKKGQEDEK
jgi:hypothetical protein